MEGLPLLAPFLQTLLVLGVHRLAVLLPEVHQHAAADVLEAHAGSCDEAAAIKRHGSSSLQQREGINAVNCGHQSLLIDVYEPKGDSEEHGRIPLEEEDVPNTQAALQGEGVDVQTQKPIGGYARGIHGEALEVRGKGGEVLLHQMPKNLLIHLRSEHGKGVVTRKEVLDDGHKAPEGILLLHEQEKRAGNKIHALAVANVGVACGVGGKDPPQDAAAMGVHHRVAREGAVEVLLDLGGPPHGLVVGVAWGVDVPHVHVRGGAESGPGRLWGPQLGATMLLETIVRHHISL
mmetsp:Transcript_24558/g.68355  ORF Transcript_24558/g.68355 Transcript_24558/m.68355 type:complete len:291 (-) Transcript_24558:850-1722(-)